MKYPLKQVIPYTIYVKLKIFFFEIRKRFGRTMAIACPMVFILGQFDLAFNMVLFSGVHAVASLSALQLLVQSASLLLLLRLSCCTEFSEVMLSKSLSEILRLRVCLLDFFL
jgi:hypothetical protein